MQKFFVVGLVSAGLLAGCGGGTGSGVGRAESPMWHMTASAEQKLEYFKSQCRGFGFKDGTPEMAQCVQNQTNQSRGSASRQWSNAMESMKGPKTTRCSRIGNTVNCSQWN